MNYLDLAAASQICHRFNLGSPPTFDRVQRLFREIYACAMHDPGYLFVAVRDHEVLSADVNSTFLGQQGLISELANEITGSLVHVVPLPGLEYNGVIVGFFR